MNENYSLIVNSELNIAIYLFFVVEKCIFAVQYMKNYTE